MLSYFTPFDTVDVLYHLFWLWQYTEADVFTETFEKILQDPISTDSGNHVATIAP